MPEVTKVPYLKSWLIYTGINVLGSAIAGFLAGGTLGAIIGVALGSSGHSLNEIRTIVQPIGAIAGFLAGLPVSYFTFKWSVNKFLLSKQQ
ncbi:MAG: hypothetical protein IPP97_26360 [Candidatus Obscuribacter sp.]|nr:hypothetical protein [Candidatus Obscuribacter sp.]MBP6348426.1 hypothetical protein [Candidatus Obscuribacter sp.]MBP6592417.1 hypothetical protein [Candidatus Obscuribacter sp.]MBP7575231.1 hypothetical protein [Candidatus Obscuribacter sp.]